MARTGLKEIFAAVRSGLLTDAELAAWMLIRTYEGSDGGCTASEETLAASRGVDPRQWRRLKAILVEKGFLETRRRGPTTPLLRTKLPDDLQDRTRGVRSREDIDGPLSDRKTGQRASGQNKRPDTRPDIRPDAERPPSIGVKEKKKNKDKKKRREINQNIREVFEYWRRVSLHAKCTFTDQREKKIGARLKDGFSVEQLMRVIDVTCATGCWHRENGHDFPETIFRSREKVEQHLERADRQNRRDGGPHYDRREDLP